MGSGDGLRVSAVPGPAHNTSVSRTSVRPKACSRVTGMCKESCRLPKWKRTRMPICNYNARTLASEAAIEDLMMQAKKIKYLVELEGNPL
ncbi:hypothetical protein RB195_024424 [Necator americanus]|uniref:Uncharacterized protein n=1 Tax=Necator americanus TaxID=51031 RepID=A0ABR1EN46_NECAM